LKVKEASRCYFFFVFILLVLPTTLFVIVPPKSVSSLIVVCANPKFFIHMNSKLTSLTTNLFQIVTTGSGKIPLACFKKHMLSRKIIIQPPHINYQSYSTGRIKKNRAVCFFLLSSVISFLSSSFFFFF